MSVVAADPSPFMQAGSGLLEHLARLSTEPLAAADRPAGRVVLVTSAHRGEGRSFVAHGLAAALAQQQDGDVVRVDAAFDTPPAGSDLSRRGAAGLSEIMTLGSLQGLSPEGGPERLWHLGRGVLAQPSLLYRPETVRKGLFALRAGFALTVLDAPCLVACGALLAEADACVLVVDARRGSRRAVQSALADSRLALDKLAGVVLNHRPRVLPSWLGGE